MMCRRLLPVATLFLLGTSVAISQNDSSRSPVTNSIGQELRFIPAGSYIRGGRPVGEGGFYKDHMDYDAADEKPRHPVRLTKPFYLGATEVTVGQFRQFVDATGYQTTAETTGAGIVGFDPHEPEQDRRAKFGFRKKPDFTWQSPGFEQTDDHPVTGVSWQDAQAFCRWLSEKDNRQYRLPTEAEWEFACRAGTETYFSWGDSYREIDRLANIGNVELEKAHPERVLIQWIVYPDRDTADPHVYSAPTGSYPANAWGIHDMHGNVWEWCQDKYLDTAYANYKAPRYDRPIPRAIDPLNDVPFTEHGDWRVIRGGSWFTSPLYCRSAIRSFYGAPDAAAYLGFRVAYDASADEIASARDEFETEEQARSAVRQIVGEFRSRSGTDIHVDCQKIPTAALTRELARIRGLSEVSINSQGKMQGELIADIAAVPDLRRLTLWNSGNDGVRDEHFAPLMARTTLEDLRIGAYPTLTDESLQYFSQLTRLQKLSLNGEKVTDEGLKQLATLTQLRELDVQGTQSNGKVLEVLREAPLEALEIRRLTDETAASLRHFPNLTRLTIHDSPMTANGFSAIAELRRLTSLRLLSCPNIPASSFQTLAGMHSLKRLDLRDTPVGDGTLGLITNLELTSLNVNSENVTDLGMRHICSMITLTDLSLGSKTQITDRGLKHLWRLNRLNRFDLYSPQITGSGFATLAELPKLYSLRLSSPELTDDVFGYLSETPVLNHVELNWNIQQSSPHLSDEGLQLLADKRNWRNVQLNRRGSSITADGVQKLRDTSNIPNIQVQE